MPTRVALSIVVLLCATCTQRRTEVMIGIATNLDAPADLSLTSMPAVAAGRTSRALAVDPLGKFLYVADLMDNSVSSYTIDAGTGALAPIGGLFDVKGQPFHLAVDPTGAHLYTVNGVSNDIGVFAIDQASGQLSGGRANVPIGANPISIAFTH